MHKLENPMRKIAKTSYKKQLQLKKKKTTNKICYTIRRTKFHFPSKENSLETHYYVLKANFSTLSKIPISG